GLARRGAAMAARVLPADDPRLLNPLSILAHLEHHVGEFDRAEAAYRRLLDIHERVDGADRVAAAPALHNLALLFQDRGNFEEAERLLLESRRIHVAAFGDDHPEAYSNGVKLSALYARMGRPVDALAAVDRANRLGSRIGKRTMRLLGEAEMKVY